MDEIVSNRTLFLLDCSNRFCRTNCGQNYDIDALNRNRQTAVITPFPSITKSLYTCSVEAIFEYSRIVWDLFPNGEKLMRFFCCSFDSVYNINSWDVSQQNYEKLIDAFALLPINLPSKKSSIIQEPADSTRHLISGLSQILCTLSTFNELAQSNQKFDKSGRVILITNFLNEAMVKLFKEEILKLFETHNRQQFLSSNGSKNVINYLDVVVLNTVPIDGESQFYFKNISRSKLSDKLSFTLHSVYSGCFLSGKLTYLAFDHHDLASTTVSGIPMKEEQNAGSSANYDVEIVHSKKVHSKFFNTGEHSLDFNLFYSDHSHAGQEYKTLILKWCTPKSNAIDVNYCIGAYRITAVDVNSRPSSCLINFLFSGKTVNLEMTVVKNSKLISHMLQCHNGELFIHVLSSIKLPIDDQPSISEGVGGRITDYRINDFADFMKNHRLLKVNNETTNLELAQVTLKNHTLYWPISYGFTAFFNIRDQLQNFYQLISKEDITENEVLELKNIIYDLVANESKGVNLPIQSNIMRIKGLKKEDIYRILWNEMEHIIQCFNKSPQHQSVLQCLLDCRPNNDTGRNAVMLMLNKNIASNNNNTRAELVDSNSIETSNNKQDSKKICLNIIPANNQSLYELYVDKMTQKNLKRRREFIGRINNEGKIAKLYCDINIE